jgi:hypothetical protein
MPPIILWIILISSAMLIHLHREVDSLCWRTKNKRRRVSAMKRLMTVLITLAVSQAGADPFTLRIGMDANAPVAVFRQFLDKANALAGEVNPDSKTEVTLYQDTFHGSNRGLSLVLSYTNAATWAAEGEINRASEKWGQLMQQFPASQFPIKFQGLSDVVWESSNYKAPDAGEVLVIFGFKNNVGGVGPLVEFARKAGALNQKLGVESYTQILVPVAAGTATGRVTITARFKSAAAWAAASEKQQASAEWGQLFQTFPGESYPLDYQGMSTVVQ